MEAGLNCTDVGGCAYCRKKQFIADLILKVQEQAIECGKFGDFEDRENWAAEILKFLAEVANEVIL
jgi:hypothetical protein